MTPSSSPSASSAPHHVGTVHRPAAPRAVSRPPRIHGLDSLRALAVMAVVVFHFAPDLLPGGFIGVDVFFVLSGFLITTLLVRERVQTGRVSLKNFWTRRARRLIPAMVVVVVTCTAVAGALGGDVLVGIRSQVLGALTFASNWVSIVQGSSYSADLSPQLFANFWSLAVEEQFYLFWPLVLLAVFTIRRSRRAGLLVTGTIAVASALWMAFLVSPGGDPTRVYFGTDSHLFGLMAGAFFALWFAPRTPEDVPSAKPGAAAEQGEAGTTGSTLAAATPLAQGALLPARGRVAAWLTVERRRLLRLGLGLTSAAGLVVLSLTLSFEAGFTYRGGLVLASLFSVGLIAFLVRSQPLAARAEVKPLRWVGVRSYGIYLWHWPLLVLVADVLVADVLVADVLGADNPGRRTSWPVAAVALVLTALAAWASYRLVERPILRRGIRAVVADGLGSARTLVDAASQERAEAVRAAQAQVTTPEGARPRRTVRARLRLGGAVFLVVVVVAALVAAFVRAPQVSSLEAQIIAGQLAAQQASPTVSSGPSAGVGPSDGPAASAPPSEAPSGDAPPSDQPGAVPPSEQPAPGEAGPTPAPAPPAGPPAGDQVTVIGDSVTLISVPALQAVLPGVHVDAEVSRQMSSVPEIVGRLRAEGLLRPYVVVSLGTNSTVNERVMDEAVGAVGPDHTLVLVTGSGDRSWMGPTNDQMRAAAGRFPNVVVADWQAAVAAEPDVMSRDGVHPQASGQELYARTVEAALAEARALREAVPAS